MTDLSHEIDALSVVVVVAFALGGVLLAGSAAVAPRVPVLEKVLAYECGFEPFEDARSRFDVRFYLVALLFIIFDLEVAFLFPLVGTPIGMVGTWFAVGFLGVLTAGFVYEWSRGALQWS